MRKFFVMWIFRGIWFLISYGIPYSIPALILSTGISGMVEQQWVLLRYQPAPSRVLTAEALPVPTNASRHLPLVRYSYRVGGHIYFGHSLTVVSAAFDGDTLRTLLGRYRAGVACTAYYDPANPAISVLDPRPRFNPYGYFLLGLMVLMMVRGAIVLLRYDRRIRVPPDPEPMANPDIVEIYPAVTLSDHRRAWRFASMAAAVGVLAVAHFYCLARPPYSSDAVSVSAVFLLIWLAVTPIAIRWWWLGRVFRDARLVLVHRQVTAGVPQKCRITQSCLHRAAVGPATLSLICRQDRGRNRAARQIIIQFQELGPAFRAAAGEELSWDAVFEVPLESGGGPLSDSVAAIPTSYMLRFSLGIGVLGTLKQIFPIRLLTEPAQEASPRPMPRHA